MSAPYWMVLGEGRPNVKHASESAARSEAERLAKVSPGKSFVVLKGVAEYRKKPDPVDVVELRGSSPWWTADWVDTRSYLTRDPFRP